MPGTAASTEGNDECDRRVLHPSPSLPSVVKTGTGQDATEALGRPSAVYGMSKTLLKKYGLGEDLKEE